MAGAISAFCVDTIKLCAAGVSTGPTGHNLSEAKPRPSQSIIVMLALINI